MDGLSGDRSHMNVVRRLAALPDSKSIPVFPTIGHMSALDDILREPNAHDLFRP